MTNIFVIRIYGSIILEITVGSDCNPNVSNVGVCGVQVVVHVRNTYINTHIIYCLAKQKGYLVGSKS